MPEPLIRRAKLQDLPQVAPLAAKLVHLHHATDPLRFFLPKNVEQGYIDWFGRELERKAAVVLVAARARAILGYSYGSLEKRDWNALLDKHGAIHDVFVAEEARRSGLGRKLVEAMVRELEALGAPRIVLSTMVGNEAAQRTFRTCGFRPTMLEMTRG